MKHNQSEDAVSPAISVILMIAVVVVLAAIVGTVAFGSVGTQGNSKAVALTANKGTSGIVFTVQGGADLPSVTALDLVSGSSITNCTGSAPKIGASCTGGTDSTGRTVMVATFADGSKQVVFDKNWGSVSGGLVGSDYATVTLTRASPTQVTFTVSATGPKIGDASSFSVYGDGHALYTDVGAGWLVTGATNTISDDSYTHFTMVLKLVDGSTVTLVDQTV